MSQISVNQLTFYYDGSYDNIFENVSFQIDTDWKLGFIARNGRGKTTFLKLLLGKYEYKGRITSAVEFDYFPFEVPDKSKDTLEVVGELFPDYEFWRICRELAFLQVEGDIFYRPFNTLSNGEQTKVMLSVLFSRENNFLLIDEPTNHLDMEARELVSSYLNKKKGFILVSHDRTFLDKCIDHVLTINKANIEIQQGNFSSWQENKKRRDDYELAENERLKKDIKRLTEAARQAHQWADKVESGKIGMKSQMHEKSIDTRAYVGEKSRRMQMRRKNLEKRQYRSIEEKSALLKNIETADDLKLFPLIHHKDVLVKTEGLGITYGKKQVIRDLNLEVRNGERVALRGKNGCGKSSIMKVVLCQTDNMQINGRVERASGLILSYVPQDTSHLQGSLTDYAKQYGIDETLFKALLKKLDFSRIQFDKPMEQYSGGQKKKVLIARSLSERAHLYIWDEPLNFIDVFSRMQIEELINKFKPTLLMVEHDKAFVNQTGARVINII